MVTADRIIAAHVNVGDIVNFEAGRHDDPDRTGMWLEVDDLRRVASVVHATGGDANNTACFRSVSKTRKVWRHTTSGADR